LGVKKLPGTTVNPFIFSTLTNQPPKRTKGDYYGRQ
jgi:hypothetical protein